jgi:hypothetical protein
MAALAAPQSAEKQITRVATLRYSLRISLTSEKTDEGVNKDKQVARGGSLNSKTRSMTLLAIQSTKVNALAFGPAPAFEMSPDIERP